MLLGNYLVDPLSTKYLIVVIMKTPSAYNSKVFIFALVPVSFQELCYLSRCFSMFFIQ